MRELQVCLAVKARTLGASASSVNASGNSRDKCRNRVGRRLKIAFAREARAAARAEIMVAVARPGECDPAREGQLFDLRAAAEWIALPLHDQGRTTKFFEVLDA